MRVQWDGSFDSAVFIMEWIKGPDAPSVNYREFEEGEGDVTHLVIHLPGGSKRVNLGDWIIHDSNGFRVKAAIGTSELTLGSKVQFSESKRWWKVRAVSDNGHFVILTSPFNLQKTVIYTIIDNERGVRGPDNMIFSSGYESDNDVAERMRELVAGEIEVSKRPSRYVELDIAVVKPNA